MKMYKLATTDGKVIMTGSHAACERYWDACAGLYEDEEGEHYIYIYEAEHDE